MNSVLENQTNIIEPNLQTILHFSDVENKPVMVDFNGGHLTSDAGILLLREVEQQIGIIRELSSVIYDPRDSRYVNHPVVDLMMQRISQIACGYEDANDCDSLRNEPIFKMFANRSPETGDALASQPTMSRFENSVSRTNLYRLARVFVENFIASYDKEPEIIVADFDDTADEVYGDQQLALFNNYYKERCYMPLHVYEGLSGKLITTILKPGKRSTGLQMLSIVKRLLLHLRKAWPNAIIVFRGDGHFSYQEVMQWIDAQANMTYVLGLTGNSVLHKLAESLVARGLKLYREDKQNVCLFHSVRYKAASWDKYRRVIIKFEVSSKGRNLRFVVTDMEQAKAKALYQQIYSARGNAELYIKEHKVHLRSDKTSCKCFMANQFRLFLHSAAYVLIHAFRANILKHTQWAKASFKTIQLRLFKIGAHVRDLKTRVKLELASNFPLKQTLSRSIQIFELLPKRE